MRSTPPDANQNGSMMLLITTALATTTAASPRLYQIIKWLTREPAGYNRRYSLSSLRYLNHSQSSSANLRSEGSAAFTSSTIRLWISVPAIPETAMHITQRTTTIMSAVFCIFDSSADQFRRDDSDCTPSLSRSVMGQKAVSGRLTSSGGSTGAYFLFLFGCRVKELVDGSIE